LAEAHGALFCEVSAKSRENVRRPFVEIVDHIVEDPALIHAAKTGRAAGSVTLDSNSEGGYLPNCSC